MVLEKTLESPLDSKEIKPVHPKGNQPWYSLEGQMLKVKLQYFGHLMRRASSLEKTLMLGKIEGRRRRGHQRMRWWMASPTQWHEFVQSLGDSEGWKPDGMQSMGVAKSWTWLNDWKTVTICHEVMGLDAMILFFFLIFSFKTAFSLSFFTLINRFFSSSLLSATRVVSSTYLRLLAIVLLAVLILAYNSSSQAFLMMWSVYKLNKYGNNK